MKQLGINERFCVLTSKWDDGYVVIDSTCIINTQTHKIIKVYRAGRNIFSGDEDINDKNVEDNIENLDKEYVTIDNEEYLVCCKDDLEDFTLNHSDEIIYTY